ncbi:MAG: hypothetical protein ACRDRH_24190 [Pseudonocardia sp.]
MSGLLPPSPAPPGSGCPQLHRPAATGSAAKVSHLRHNVFAGRSEPQDRGTRLGHATVAFTLDTYTEDVPELHHAAAETVSGLFLDDDVEAPDEPPIDLP